MKKPKLTFTTGPDASSCGCVWRRTVEFGDVIVKQCREHARQGKARGAGSKRSRS